MERINKSTACLIGFIIVCLITSLPIDDIRILMIFRFFKHLFLLLYYLSLSEKRDVEVILIIILFTIASVFSTEKVSNLIGLVFVMLYRILLLRYSYKKLQRKLINKKTGVLVFALFLLIGTLIVSLYSNSSSFYIVIVLGFLLIANLFLSYLNLLNTPKKGNLTFFIAISFFTISDAIFGVVLLGDNNYLYQIATIILYNSGYFLIIQSAIQNEISYKKVTLKR